MKIRIAAENDYEDIQRLNHLLFKKEFEEYEPTLNVEYPYNTQRGKEYFMEAIREDKHLALVVEDEGRIIGYLIGYFNGKQEWRNNIIQATLQNMFVEEKYRSKGIGAELIENFRKWAKGKGANVMQVNAFIGNKRGLNFYHKMGFEEYNVNLERKI